MLLVSYYYPPLGGIGSLRALKFATHLRSFGFEATVLTVSNGAYFVDHSLAFDPAQVERCSSFELSRLGKRVVDPRSGDVRSARVGGLARRVQSFVRRWLYRPDGQIGWYPGAVAAGRRLLRERRFDVIFSSSGPMTAHLIARRLKRDFDIPWVADVRDPWADAVDADPAQHAYREHLERDLLREADEVVAVSPSLAAMLSRRSGRLVHVVTNGFDPSDIPARPEERRDEIVFVHLGSFYPHMQDLRVLWPAIRELAERAPGRVRIRFVGELPRALGETLSAIGLGGLTESTGFLPYRAALARVVEASVLVVGGSRGVDPILKCLLPAKLFDYLGTDRPIIYVGDLDSDAARLLSSVPGCEAVGVDDVESAKKAIARFLASGPFPRSLDKYTRRHLAGELAGILRAAMARATRRRTEDPRVGQRSQESGPRHSGIGQAGP
ncbi:MAG: glycosyltransferase [Vicinamibacteria bacterium]